ncbi:ECF transporter S component [Atopobium fossor]|uniref:ECF transporter S component n=1 Tax=Atopobium fossor TaxID=39487 RepID=UPI000415A567|nr:ECF transporter S component [Atopobium fossor]
MAQSTSNMHHDSHSTTAQGTWTTKRIAVTALLCAVSAICTLFLEFPILPGLEFLKYDPSGIVALIGGFAFGPATAAIISVLPYLVHFATHSGFYGVIMAIVATISLALPAILIYQRKATLAGALLGMVVGAVCCIVACIVGNLILTPLYMGTSFDDVVALIVPALLPFNLVKILINCVVTAIMYKPITKALSE